MKEFTYTIKDLAGIHARPAGILVKEAKKFSSSITMEKSGEKGDLKRIFTVMGLNVQHGDTVTIQVDGTDEDVAVTAIKRTFESSM